MKTRITCNLLGVLSLVCCLVITVPAFAASDEAEVLAVASNFTRAFGASDYELMSSIHWHSNQLSKYAPGAAGAFLTLGWETIGKDWADTLKLPEGTYVVGSHNQQATMLGKDAAVTTQYVSVVYTDPGTGAQSTGQVRQTLVLKKIDGKWLIVHEHASNLPVE